MSRIAGLALVAVLMALVAAFPARAQVPDPPKTPVAEGTGGSAATVDPLATKAAIKTLRAGGNAVDAAVAAAGVLGVVEPFSCGIGGGGFMVVYDARRHKVDTIDSRETAPAGMKPDDFGNPPAKPAIDFTEARVGGLSVGVPGTVRGWQTALKRYGTRSLKSLLKPGERIANQGFTIDPTFHQQVTANEAIFNDFPATKALYLTDDGKARTGVQKNPDLAATYKRIAGDPDRFYSGRLAREISQTVRHPPLRAGSTRPVHPGTMTVRDLERYRAKQRKPTRISYRGLDVFGMGPPSSGGSTVGEALNILEGFPRNEPRVDKLHHYLEASKLAYADRNEFVADPDFEDVPLRGLLSDPFAASRRSLIEPTAALPAPVDPGDPWKYNGGGHNGQGHGPSGDEHGLSTTHMTIADRWGNIVSYTFTIEQTGGSGMVVPGRGFLLNNELTDFNFATGTKNSPAAGKRPRSSISPTIVFDHGKPAVALGSPGGATIITTVLQILVNEVDFRQSLPDALAAPRASQRNAAPPEDAPVGTLEKTEAEPAFIVADSGPLEDRGHYFTEVAEIGAATGIRFLRGGSQQAVAEPTRRGGGSAMVVEPG
jgi:gamma-glutamyltranspeptidase/glutathione hydrolase